MISRSPSRIAAIQRSHHASLVKLARESASRCETLRHLAKALGMNYSSLKMALAKRGYKHPRGMALVDAHYGSISGMDIASTVAADLARRGLTGSTS